MLVALTAMWTERSQVLAAYDPSNSQQVELRFTGVDLDFESIAIPPSPYQLEPAPDTRQTVLSLQVGQPDTVTTPEVLLFDGLTSFGGVVTGPDGPVEGAVVDLERHTTSTVNTTQVITDVDGNWKVEGLIGGRFRIRAWKPNELTMTSSEVVFVSDGEEVTMDLVIGPVEPGPHLRFKGAGDVHVGDTAIATVSVTTSSIDQDGFELATGLPGQAVTLRPGPGVLVAQQADTTDAGGGVHFVVRCLSEGNFGAVIGYESITSDVSLVDCLAAPEPDLDLDLGPESGEPTADANGDDQ